MNIFKIRGYSKIEVSGQEILTRHKMPTVDVIAILNANKIEYKYLNSNHDYGAEIIAEITYKSGRVFQYILHTSLDKKWRHFKTLKP